MIYIRHEAVSPTGKRSIIFLALSPHCLSYSCSRRDWTVQKFHRIYGKDGI